MWAQYLTRIALLISGLFLLGANVMGAYPERPVRVVIPFSPGGGTDIVGRVVAEQLTGSFGTTFLVDNRPGGGGAVGASLVAQAAPDGYTMLVGTSAELTIVPMLYPSTRYKPAADFWPVALLGTSPNILIAHPRFPGKDVRELIAHAKSNPGKLTYASGGIGTSPHLSGELLKSMAGIDMVHVAYKGSGPAQNDLLGGQIELMFSTMGPATPLVKANRIKALAVTSSKRSPLLPDVPTVAEQGLAGYEAVTWYGLFVPMQTPKDVVRRLRTDVDKALSDKNLQNRLDALGIEAGSIEQGGEVLQNRVKNELSRWGRVIKEAGIKAE